MPFEKDRGRYLIIEHDDQSKLIQKLLENKKESVCLVSFSGENTFIIDIALCNRRIKESIRIIDTSRISKKHVMINFVRILEKLFCK